MTWTEYWAWLREVREEDLRRAIELRKVMTALVENESHP